MTALLQSDADLLRQYTAGRSADAFSALVSRYIDLVYSSAVRQVRDRHLAEDVTQVVFVALARKAESVAHLPSPAAWLLKTARLASLEALRKQARRQRHERLAAEVMGMNEAQSSGAAGAFDDAAEHLDEAFERLGKKDRTALVMRFFENQSHRDIGQKLGLGEEAARQRVCRALDELRRFFGARGIEITTASIVAGLSTQAVQAAPAGLATAVSAGAAAQAGGLGLLGKGALILMTATKAKVVGVAVAVLLLGGGVALVVQSELWRPKPVVIVPTPPRVDQPDPEATAKQDDAAAQLVVNRHYGLADGQNLRLVAPPFIPERRLLAISVGPGEDHSRNGTLRVNWSDGQARPMSHTYNGMRGSTLEELMLDVVGVASYEIDAPWTLLDLRLKGDWVIREGSTPEMMISTVPEIVRERTGVKIVLEKRRIERDVYLARGKYVHSPLKADSPKDMLYVTTREDAIDDGGGHRAGGSSGRSLSNFMRQLSHTLGTAIFNETDSPEPDKAGSFWYVSPTAELRRLAPGAKRQEAMQQVLEMLSRQTGLTFEKGRREIDVWRISAE